MSYGEYLRRKLECQQKVFGPSRIGDEGLRTMMTRYKANANCSVSGLQITTPTCCQDKTPYWRDRLGRPNNGPFRRAGDGQEQEWSSDSVRERAAGRAVCLAGSSGYIIQAGCPEEFPNEVKPLALQGKETCCPFITAVRPEPDCSCATEPGRSDTLWANNMPNTIVVPSEDSCCSIQLPPPAPVEICYCVVEGYTPPDAEEEPTRSINSNNSTIKERKVQFVILDTPTDPTPVVRNVK